MGISRISTLILITSATLLAQVGTSSLSGTVIDPSGAVVPKASVALTSSEQTFTRTTITGSDGVYVIPTLPPGTYAESRGRSLPAFSDSCDSRPTIAAA